MKRIICCLVALTLMLSAACFAAAEADADVKALRSAHQVFVLDALQGLAQYGIDRCDQGWLTQYFEKDSPAWKIIAKFNKGFYPDVRNCTFSGLSTDNWVKVSEQEFQVDVFGTAEVVLNADLSVEVYPCRYRFSVRANTPGRWRVYDFETLPSPEDEALVERLNTLRPGVHFETVTGKAFRGYLMTVDDPADVFVGTCEFFSDSAHGLEASAMAERYHAFAVVNGGGFKDDMKGGRPCGVVITRGWTRQAHNQYDKTTSAVVAFTSDNRLLIDHFTVDELEAYHPRDAVAFNPLLIRGGKEVGEDTRDIHSEYTIRTVVGKDAEGRAVFLIIKGRQSDSLGATTKDMTALLLERGIVAAANMDGGTSTALYVNGEIIYSGYRFRSSRFLPTAFIIGGRAQ